MRYRFCLCLLVLGLFVPTDGGSPTGSSLIEAASLGDTEKAQTLLAQGADVNAKDSDGKPA